MKGVIKSVDSNTFYPYEVEVAHPDSFEGEEPMLLTHFVSDQEVLRVIFEEE